MTNPCPHIILPQTYDKDERQNEAIQYTANGFPDVPSEEEPMTTPVLKIPNLVSGFVTRDGKIRHPLDMFPVKATVHTAGIDWSENPCLDVPVRNEDKIYNFLIKPMFVSDAERKLYEVIKEVGRRVVYTETIVSMLPTKEEQQCR